MKAPVTAVEHRVPLGQLRSTLASVLAELAASDVERRPFVLVEDARTRQFCQFARRCCAECFPFLRRYWPKTGELLFDVPALGVVLVPCPDPQTGADWAVCAMSHQFGLPVDATIGVRLDGDPRN